MRILALDYGTKRIGVAVSDERATIARPVAVVPSGGIRPDLRVLDPLVRELEPGEVVVGVPRRLDGSPGTLAAVAVRSTGDHSRVQVTGSPAAYSNVRSRAPLPRNSR